MSSRPVKNRPDVLLRECLPSTAHVDYDRIVACRLKRPPIRFPVIQRELDLGALRQLLDVVPSSFLRKTELGNNGDRKQREHQLMKRSESSMSVSNAIAPGTLNCFAARSGAILHPICAIATRVVAGLMNLAGLGGVRSGGGVTRRTFSPY